MDGRTISVDRALERGPREDRVGPREDRVDTYERSRPSAGSRSMGFRVSCSGLPEHFTWRSVVLQVLS